MLMSNILKDDFSLQFTLFVLIKTFFSAVQPGFIQGDYHFSVMCVWKNKQEEINCWHMLNIVVQEFVQILCSPAIRTPNGVCGILSGFCYQDKSPSPINQSGSCSISSLITQIKTTLWPHFGAMATGPQRHIVLTQHHRLTLLPWLWPGWCKSTWFNFIFLYSVSACPSFFTASPCHCHQASTRSLQSTVLAVSRGPAWVYFRLPPQKLFY